MKSKLYIFWPVVMEAFTIILACSIDRAAIAEPGVHLALHFDPSQWAAMLLSPWFLLCATCAALGITWLRKVWARDGAYTDTDKMVMVWFLMNACWYHTGCDVMSGLFQVMPNLRDAYAISNASHLMPMHDLHRIALDSVYWLELLIQLPLCLWVLRLYANRSAFRPSVEIFLCSLHFAGTWAYYVPYLLMGETSNPIVSNMDRTIALTWIIVPIVLSVRAAKQIAAAAPGVSTAPAASDEAA